MGFDSLEIFHQVGYHWCYVLYVSKWTLHYQINIKEITINQCGVHSIYPWHNLLSVFESYKVTNVVNVVEECQQILPCGHLFMLNKFVSDKYYLLYLKKMEKLSWHTNQGTIMSSLILTIVTFQAYFAFWQVFPYQYFLKIICFKYGVRSLKRKLSLQKHGPIEDKIWISVTGTTEFRSKNILEKILRVPFKKQASLQEREQIFQLLH